MYGNFTSNYYKINLTQHIWKYYYELSPAFASSSQDQLYDLELKIKSVLYDSSNIFSLVKNSAVFTLQQMPLEMRIPLNYGNCNYIISLIPSPNLLVTEITEQKEFLMCLFEESLEELKYLKFQKGYYNPFEAFTHKPLDLIGWQGFSLRIKQFFNDFTLQIIPKILIFQRKNCLETLKELNEIYPGIAFEDIKGIFKGHQVKGR